MKVGHTIFEEGDHKWIAIARDPERPDNLIDTIEYLIIKKDKGCLLDPGGVEIFPSVFSVVGREIESANIEFLFSSHEDPDIVSSLALWVAFNPAIKCYISWLWGGFIPHYGCARDTLLLIPDEGQEILLNNSLKLQLIPAHHLHASGNFHVYDPAAKILFSGDVGAALFDNAAEQELMVKNFSQHIDYMKFFHQRWMPSNTAKNDWIDRVSQLEIDMLCPQHGSIFVGEDVPKFLQWFRDLDVGLLSNKK